MSKEHKVILVSSVITLIAGAILSQLIPKDCWMLIQLISCLTQFPGWVHGPLIAVLMMAILSGWVVVFRWPWIGRTLIYCWIGLAFLPDLLSPTAQHQPFYWKTYLAAVGCSVAIVGIVKYSWWSRLILTAAIMAGSLAFLSQLSAHDVVSIQIGIVIFDILAVYCSPFMDYVAEKMGSSLVPNQFLIPSLSENEDEPTDQAAGLGGGDIVVPGLVLMLAMQTFSLADWATWVTPCTVLLGWIGGYVVLLYATDKLSERKSHPATITLSPGVLIGYYLGSWLTSLLS